MDDQEHITAEEYMQIMLAAQGLQRALRRLSVDAWGTMATGPNIMAEMAHRVPEAMAAREDGQ